MARTGIGWSDGADWVGNHAVAPPDRGHLSTTPVPGRRERPPGTRHPWSPGATARTAGCVGVRDLYGSEVLVRSCCVAIRT